MVNYSERIKDFKIPDILRVAFYFDKDKLVYIDNKVTC
jgi:hypothetical protein